LLLKTSLVALGLAAGGCADRSLALSAEPDLLAQIARAGAGESGSLARAQKPDGRTASGSVLDVIPERSTEAALGQPADIIRATVNCEAILDSEVRAASYQVLMSIRALDLPKEERAHREAEVFKAALDQLIEREVVIQDAIARLAHGPASKVLDHLKESADKEFDKRWVQAIKNGNGIKSDDELKAILRAQGVSLEMIRRQWQRNFIAQEYLRNRVISEVERVGHAQMVEYYEKHPEEFKVDDSVHWQDIFVHATLRHNTREAARRFAEVLAGRVRTGEDFAALSKQFDDGESALRGGEGIGRKRGEIKPPEAEALLFQMRDGEVRVLEVESGFHVIRMVKRQFAGKMPFDEKVQREVRDKLRNQVAQREIKRLVADLKRKAVIEYASRAN
jgi:hypothetical protein